MAEGGYEKRDNSGGKSEAVFDDLDPLLQGFDPVLKLALGKLHMGAGFKEFMLHSCL